MSTEAVRLDSTSTIRTARSGSLGSVPISVSKGPGLRPGSTPSGRPRCESRKTTRGVQGGLGQDPMDCEPTHTITCQCCGTTTRVPTRRRFLCDTCFHDGPG
jgi:hypothetical protein